MHLNPVRAQIVAADQAANFRWSSLGRFLRGPRFPGLEASDWLTPYNLVDRKEDWSIYLTHLKELAVNLEEQKRLGWAKFSHGWALGSEAWKADLSKRYAQRKLNPGLEASQLKEFRDMHWQELLREQLAKHGRTELELHEGPKNKPWKVETALYLRSQHGAACQWLATAMNLGTPGTTRNLLFHAKHKSV